MVGAMSADLFLLCILCYYSKKYEYALYKT